MPAIEAALREVADAVERSLGELLPSDGGETPLAEAMRYGALGGGKRLRPFLVLAGARLAGAPDSASLPVAAAIEMVHCYSLIHDDLPCMDDDVLRRGRPTVHVKYDEATAVLAGDALLTEAFGVLARAEIGPAETRAALVAGLARAAGPAGMAGGQMLDLMGEGKTWDEAGITRMERLKTGALIAFACEAGAIVAAAPAEHRARLRRYGEHLGLAFQITDDLLDVRGEAGEIGKSVGKDAIADKATFVKLLGLDGAQTRAEAEIAAAAEQLAIFGENADSLRALGDFVLHRRA
ncbi:MAG: polyprenyl synthetase family protein [Alphaproteobacteria bacterium]